MDLIITQQDTLIWCRFINIDLSAFHKETDMCIVWYKGVELSNDWWICLIARKNILKIYTTGQFHDAKINKTTPTQLDVIRLSCWFTNLKNWQKDVTGCYQSHFYYFILLQVYDTGQQPIIEIYEQTSLSGLVIFGVVIAFVH